MSSPAPFDWKSLITPLAALGGKALGDAVAPDASLQNARTNAQTAQVSNEIARARMANANQIRSTALPSLYTNLGYAPQQSRVLAGNYTGNVPSAYSGGGSPSGGSNVGKAVLGAGISAAPAVLSRVLSKAAPTMTRQAIQVGAPAAAAATTAQATGITGALGFGGGAGLLGLGAATVPVLGGAAALGAYIWKKSQAHPTADKWVQGEQNPFDQHWAQLKQSGLPPAQLKQAQTQSAQNYLTSLSEFAQGGGHNMEVAQNAARTFRQYYGDPAQYGVQLPF